MMIELTDKAIIELCMKVGFNDKQWSAMTYESGKYEVTTPTNALKELVQQAKAEGMEEAAKMIDAYFARTNGGDWGVSEALIRITNEIRARIKG